MYQALYRKWRPKSFEDVVGQQHITETLQHQVAENRLSHAYLFTGTRGTGKTTCAKILAKAANCENPINGSPCNCCPSCQAIDSGNCLDVLELDAASNNGVDQVRALREDAIYAPASVKKRVYIVDEVHMLTISAFNALLKILEEPPEHLMFILATTELQKVPATILSRCQRYSFRRILPQDIVGRLLYVAKEEKIPLTQEGAELLARLADGALRDALSLLDQCMTIQGDITAASILDVLGLAGNIQTAELCEHILQRELEPSLLLLNQLYSDGKDVAAILNELSTLCRDLLLRRTAPQGGEVLMSGGFDTSTMEHLLSLSDSRRLLYMTEQLQRSAASLPGSTNRRTEAELCLMRLCDESLCGDPDALSHRISRLESAFEQGIPAAPAAKAAVVPAPKNDEPPFEVEPPKVAAPKKEPVPAVAPQKAESVPSASPVSDDRWASFLALCKGQLPIHRRIFLNQSQGIVNGQQLDIYCDNDAAMNTLSMAETYQIIRDAVTKVYGEGMSLKLIPEKAPKGNATSSSKAVPAPAPAVEAPVVAPQPTSAPASEDMLDDLINFSKQFDEIKIE